MTADEESVYLRELDELDELDLDDGVDELTEADNELRLILAFIARMPTWHISQVVEVKAWLRSELTHHSHRVEWTF